MQSVIIAKRNIHRLLHAMAAKHASYLVEEKQAICLPAAAIPSWTLAAIANELNRTDNNNEVLHGGSVVANWPRRLGHTFACLLGV
jgi:hypothetical protein